jgi:hypothetical protein
MKQFRGLDHQKAGKFKLELEEEMKVKRYLCHFKFLYTFIVCLVANLCPTLYGPFCCSDILKSVMTRTKALMLHIQDQWTHHAELADLYDSFQDQCTELLSEENLSYVQIHKFMPILLQLWSFSELKKLNTNKEETDMIAEEK